MPLRSGRIDIGRKCLDECRVPALLFFRQRYQTPADEVSVAFVEAFLFHSNKLHVPLGCMEQLRSEPHSRQPSALDRL